MQTTQALITLTPDLFALIDEAGSIDYEIKRLTKQLDAIKATLKTNGSGKQTGFLWTANIVDVQNADFIDWETIAKRFDPSRQLIAAHTKAGASFQRVNFSKI